MIHSREPIAQDVIGFMDGLSLHCDCTLDTLEQNAMYSGYHCDIMVNNIFAYTVDRRVFLCGLNFPGSWHDESICAKLMPIIWEKIHVFKNFVDQGFSQSGDAYDILVGPISRRPEVICCLFFIHTSWSCQIKLVSLKQASEWGVHRGLQGSFPHFKKWLPSDATKRKKYHSINNFDS